MKIVVDTNVLVSATCWTGTPRELLRLAFEGRFRAIVSREMFAEYIDVIHREKFSCFDGRALKRFTRILEESVEIIKAGPEQKVIAEDPSDDKVLSCAKAARADLIVTGDEHLLKLRKWNGIRIISPRQTIEMIGSAKRRKWFK